MIGLLVALYNRRVRGFRVVHVGAVACLFCLMLSVYMTKTSAGREATAIAQLNSEITSEQRRLRLLKAELAHLEQPQRLESLSSRYLALEPIPAQRETMADGLAEVARRQRAGSLSQ